MFSAIILKSIEGNSNKSLIISVFCIKIAAINGAIFNI